jgi:hypothetical protein
MRVKEVEAVESQQDTVNTVSLKDPDLDLEVTVVPNLLADVQEIDRLVTDIHSVDHYPQRERLVNFTHFTMPLYNNKPLSEFNNTQPLLSLAFLSLFPQSIAEFTTP